MKHGLLAGIRGRYVQGTPCDRQFIGHGVRMKRDSRFCRRGEDKRAVSAGGNGVCEKSFRKRRQRHNVQVLLVFISSMRDVPSRAVSSKPYEFRFPGCRNLIAALAQQNGELDHCPGLRLAWQSRPAAPLPNRLEFFMREQPCPPFARRALSNAIRRIVLNEGFIPAPVENGGKERFRPISLNGRFTFIRNVIDDRDDVAFC